MQGLRRGFLIIGWLTASLLGIQLAHAQYTADYQANIISGVTNNWPGDYVVGSNTLANVLLIQNGGMLSNATGCLGYETGSSNNNALIIGTGSIWTNSSDLFVGRGGADNQLTIAGGGIVCNTYGYLGYESTSINNNVIVTGAGSYWYNQGNNLYLGYSSAYNNLEISDGGKVFDYYAILGWNSGSSSNSAWVAGSDAAWTNAYGIYVGWESAGNCLVVSNGGKLSAAGFGIGYASSSSTDNTMLVTGPGSAVGYTTVGDAIGIMAVGWAGARNSLVISNSGTVSNSFGYLGAKESASSNSVRVSGNGSLWVLDRNLFVGSPDLGYGGSGAANNLEISDGGQVIDDFGYLGGTSSSSNNSVLVVGAGSVWSNGSALYVGSAGPGNSLVISNGGSVISSSTDTGSCVGYGISSSNNTLMITGPGSVWRTLFPMKIGSDGAGNRFVVSNGGKAVSGGIFLGGNASSSNNDMLVTGSGSVVSNQTLAEGSSVFVGWSGADNSLVISNGGVVLGEGGAMGYSTSSSNNSALVTGSGSVWSNYYGPDVGYYAGSGNSLVISDGGRVVSSFRGYIGGGVFDAISSNNTALVADNGTWECAGTLYVGQRGRSNMLAISSGSVIASNVVVSYKDQYGSGTNNIIQVQSGSLVVTNAVGNGNLVVGMAGAGMAALLLEDGVVAVDALDVINGTNSVVTVDGGTLKVFKHLTTAGCPGGIVTINGGGLFVTNTIADAVLDVRGGSLILNGGTLRADKLVMTNACGLFVRNGGTLILGSLILDPNLDADGDGMPNGWEQTYGFDPLNAADAYLDSDGDGVVNWQESAAGTNPTNSASFLHITSLTFTNDDVQIDWTTVGGKSYILQTTSNLLGNFGDSGPVIVMPGTGEATTNCLDPGAATNWLPRFYRIRLVP